MEFSILAHNHLRNQELVFFPQKKFPNGILNFGSVCLLYARIIKIKEKTNNFATLIHNHRSSCLGKHLTLMTIAEQSLVMCQLE